MTYVFKTKNELYNFFRVFMQSKIDLQLNGEVIENKLNFWSYCPRKLSCSWAPTVVNRFVISEMISLACIVAFFFFSRI